MTGTGVLQDQTRPLEINHVMPNGIGTDLPLFILSVPCSSSETSVAGSSPTTLTSIQPALFAEFNHALVILLYAASNIPPCPGCVFGPDETRFMYASGWLVGLRCRADGRIRSHRQRVFTGPDRPSNRTGENAQ